MRTFWHEIIYNSLIPINVPLNFKFFIILVTLQETVREL